MAQVCFGQSDLRKALLRVRRPAVGVRNVSDMFRINFLEQLPSVASVFFSPMYDTAVLEKYISVCDEDIQARSSKNLTKYFNTYPPFQFSEALLSGSWCEGLTMHHIQFTSDMDFMCILKNISFSEEDQACGNLAVKEDTPFVNACITDPELLKMWEDFLEDPAEDTIRRQLSSRKLKAMLFENYEKRGGFLDGDSEKCSPVGDGPALKLEKELPKFDPHDLLKSIWLTITYKVIASSDITLGISCGGWPRCALEWLSRDRRWPDTNLVQKICQEGFHIVPKNSPEGGFRLSFSNAEVTLIENLTPLQHKVIRAFKAVIKYHQSHWSPNIKDIICTYHLKTIAFWHVEKTTQDSWTEDNVVSHLVLLIEEFAQALRKGNLPMYFLPKYNLLENVENAEEIKKISDKVAELSRDIPAITKAVDEVANFTLGDILCVELFSAVTEHMDKEAQVLKLAKFLKCIRDGKESGAGSGNAPADDTSWRNFAEDVLNDANAKADELGAPKEWCDALSFIGNVGDSLISCFENLKKENETFINLD